jgi:hypothetical protein
LVLRSWKSFVLLTEIAEEALPVVGATVAADVSWAKTEELPAVSVVAAIKTNVIGINFLIVVSFI